MRRIAGERHLDFGVVRQIEEAPKRIDRPAHRPAAGDFYLAPVRSQLLFRSVEKLNAPPAVKGDSVGMRHAMHRQTADGRELGRSPRPGEHGAASEVGLAKWLPERTERHGSRPPRQTRG